MTEPLLTEAEAKARSGQLLASFASCADILSPDEQALAMEVLWLRVRLQQLEQDIRHAGEAAEARYKSRLAEGTMYETLSQHLVSTSVAYEDCASRLASLLEGK